MISAREQKRLVAVVNRGWLEEGITDRFRKLAAGKEPGHRIADYVEERTVAMMEAAKFDVAFERSKNGARRPRSLGDIWLRSKGATIHDPINIKSGLVSQAGGQPNMVALKKLSDMFFTSQIDSYWPLLIRLEQIDDGFRPQVRLINLFYYLDYMHFDSGTGQLMLKNDHFYAHMEDLGEPTPLSAGQIAEWLLERRRAGDLKLIENRANSLRKTEAAASRYDSGATVDQSSLGLTPDP